MTLISEHRERLLGPPQNRQVKVTDFHSPDATKGAETPTCAKCGRVESSPIHGPGITGHDFRPPPATPSTGADTPQQQDQGWTKNPVAALPESTPTPAPDASGCQR